MFCRLALGLVPLLYIFSLFVFFCFFCFFVLWSTPDCQRPWQSTPCFAGCWLHRGQLGGGGAYLALLAAPVSLLLFGSVVCLVCSPVALAAHMSVAGRLINSYLLARVAYFVRYWLPTPKCFSVLRSDDGWRFMVLSLPAKEVFSVCIGPPLGWPCLLLHLLLLEWTLVCDCLCLFLPCAVVLLFSAAFLPLLTAFVVLRFHEPAT